jgi:DNA polymerase III alpha subunit
LYLGFVHVASLEQKLVQRLVQDRLAHGVYRSLFDFKERVDPGLEQLKTLIRIGAFRFTGKNRKALMWEAHWLTQKKLAAASRKGKKAKEEHIAEAGGDSVSGVLMALDVPPVQSVLFREAPKAFVLPALEYDGIEDAFEQIELLGFPLCNPFDLVDRSKGRPQALHTAESIQRCIGRRVEIEGYLVTIKPTRTAQGQEMNFGTWIDRRGHYFDSLHFPEAVRKWPFKGRGVYLMQGLVSDDFGVISIAIERMEKLAYVADPRWD